MKNPKFKYIVQKRISSISIDYAIILKMRIFWIFYVGNSVINTYDDKDKAITRCYKLNKEEFHEVYSTKVYIK